MRVLITSDLHLETTGIATIRRLVAGIEREEPDLLVIAGDIGNPSQLFEKCLSAFLPLDCPIAVLPGNADLWGSLGETSIALYDHLLPAITRSLGYHWLETDPLLLPNRTALLGALAWYDYSAATQPEPAAHKPTHCLDTRHIDWEYTDPEFADLGQQRLRNNLDKLQADSEIDHILAITHFPTFKNQFGDHPNDDPEFLRTLPFLANFTLGHLLSQSPKVRWVVSGHLHTGANGLVERNNHPPIATATIPSDHGRPRWITLEL